MSGVNYSVISQTPEHLVGSVQALANTPLSGTRANGGGSIAELLGNLATISHAVDPAVVDHYSVQRVIDVNCAVSGRDLGAATADVERSIAVLGALPPGTKVTIRGQSEAMRTSFRVPRISTPILGASAAL